MQNRDQLRSQLAGSRNRGKDDVNMVGHNAPGMESVSVSVKMLQRFKDNRCDFRILQPAVSRAVVQVLFDSVGKQSGDLAFFMFRQLSFLISRPLFKFKSFEAPLFQECSRHGAS